MAVAHPWMPTGTDLGHVRGAFMESKTFDLPARLASLPSTGLPCQMAVMAKVDAARKILIKMAMVARRARDRSKRENDTSRSGQDFRCRLQPRRLRALFSCVL